MGTRQEALHMHEIVREGGRIELTGLPIAVGERVEVIVLTRSRDAIQRYPTVRDWKESGLVGIWKDRADIKDSSQFAETVRDRLQRTVDRS